MSGSSIGLLVSFYCLMLCFLSVSLFAFLFFYLSVCWFVCLFVSVCLSGVRVVCSVGLLVCVFDSCSSSFSLCTLYAVNLGIG